MVQGYTSRICSHKVVDSPGPLLSRVQYAHQPDMNAMRYPTLMASVRLSVACAIRWLSRADRTSRFSAALNDGAIQSIIPVPESEQSRLPDMVVHSEQRRDKRTIFNLIRQRQPQRPVPCSSPCHLPTRRKSIRSSNLSTRQGRNNLRVGLHVRGLLLNVLFVERHNCAATSYREIIAYLVHTACLVAWRERPRSEKFD